MYCNIVFMIDIFVISKITQYRYYVIAITDVRSLGLSTKWRTLMIKKTMKVRENTFRKLEDPFENGAAKKYVFYVKVDDVAEGIPMATNPRDQKLTSGVATAIKESLLSNDGYFHLKNRGIVLSAESVHYNNKEKIATIIFSDELSHGNIDGGHTYKIVCEHKGENLEQYVQFEVMTGVEDIIENLAEARNTSVQVDAKSMAELAEKFDPIKEGLEGMPFFKRIAFKQNQISVDDETGKYFKTGICKIFDSYENYSIRQWHKVIPIFSVFDYIPNLIDGIVNGKVNSLLELLPEDNKMVNRISIKNVQDLCTALEVSYQLDDKRKREKDALIEELKKNIKNTIAEFTKAHNEIDVNKETTMSSAFQYLDYTLKQKILTLYNENSDIVDEIVSKYSLPSVNENSIASFVKLRNNKTHSGTVEWGESAKIYTPLFAIVYASFFKYIKLPDEVIKSTLLQIF